METFVFHIPPAFLIKNPAQREFAFSLSLGTYRQSIKGLNFENQAVKLKLHGLRAYPTTTAHRVFAIHLADSVAATRRTRVVLYPSVGLSVKGFFGFQVSGFRFYSRGRLWYIFTSAAFRQHRVFAPPVDTGGLKTIYPSFVQLKPHGLRLRIASSRELRAHPTNPKKLVIETRFCFAKPHRLISGFPPARD